MKTLALKKCEFEKEEIDFLGYRVSPDGIRPLPKKGEAISKFPDPKKQKDLLGFVWCLTYFRSSLGYLRKGDKKITCADLAKQKKCGKKLRLKSGGCGLG